ncbi:phosphotransferase [Streptomyces sp. YIM 98790]|uniref:phosphotransferase n=1 Tax=Streptomyces sp. YIM 98790 TaxID=2689077 RepID=UPI00140DE435|nr:phosphotransferase [Streptomyces sp. YIM 98790]
MAHDPAAGQARRSVPPGAGAGAGAASAAGAVRELFDPPVLELAEVVPDSGEHGSLVFRVRTAREHVIARTFRLPEATGPFWGTLRTLFGTNPLDVSEVVAAHRLLGPVSPIPVPGVLRVRTAGSRGWVVVELMPGSRLRTFAELSDGGLAEFGRSLAGIHARASGSLGTPSGSVRFAPGAFPGRLAAVLRGAAGKRAGGTGPGSGGDSGWEAVAAAAAALPPPEAGVPVMPDISPGQFLRRRGRITAMVDVDAYVLGPRELDLVFLEFFVDDRAAALIARGYRDVLPFPRLARVRAVYRRLGRLLRIREDLGPGEWPAWPEFFR